jgi:excisionase family DNA binding protein
MIEPELLTLAEASKLLRVKVPTLRSWRSQGKLSVVKLGGRVLIRRTDLEALIAASLIPARGKAAA